MGASQPITMYAMADCVPMNTVTCHARRLRAKLFAPVL